MLAEMSHAWSQYRQDVVSTDSLLQVSTLTNAFQCAWMLVPTMQVCCKTNRILVFATNAYKAPTSRTLCMSSCQH